MKNNKKAGLKNAFEQQNKKGKEIAKKDGFRYDYNDSSDFQGEK
ncbi:hypothetical protein [Paucisalibacillus sp. EB02]|nr:hypothetical protein [Paucisalibacillus sp. EB02]